MPEVLGAGEPAEGCPWPWSVYRWLPGELPEAGAPTDPGALAADLAGFVTAMRRITLPNAPKAYRGGRLNAVIDFGCLGVGDPACDLLPAWNLLPADAREVLRQRLGVDDATWRRGRGRALSQAVTALPYYRDTNAAMAGNARHVVREVLAEKRRAGRYS